MKSHEGDIVRGFPSIIKSNNFESAQNQKNIQNYSINVSL